MSRSVFTANFEFGEHTEERVGVNPIQLLLQGFLVPTAGVTYNLSLFRQAICQCLRAEASDTKAIKKLHSMNVEALVNDFG